MATPQGWWGSTHLIKVTPPGLIKAALTPGPVVPERAED